MLPIEHQRGVVSVRLHTPSLDSQISQALFSVGLPACVLSIVRRIYNVTGTTTPRGDCK